MSTYFSRSDINFSFPAGAQGAVVRDLFLADVNGDGRQDAVVTYEYYPLQNQPIAVRVLTGDGHGGFAADASGVFSGAPNTAISPSPRNLSTEPLWRKTTGTMRRSM